MNQLIPQPTCRAYCEIAGDIRVRFGKELGVMIVPVTKHLLNKINQKNRTSIRTALGIRPSGWNRRQPGGISLVNHKLCKFGVLREQLGRISWGFPGIQSLFKLRIRIDGGRKDCPLARCGFQTSRGYWVATPGSGRRNPVVFNFANYELCKVGILRERFGHSP